MSRKLITNTFVSLDGVMHAPGGPDEDPSDGFELGGWMVGYSDESTRKALDAMAAGVLIATYRPAGSIKLGSVDDEAVQ